MDDMTQNPGPTAGPTTQSHPDGHGNGLDRFFGWIRSVDLRRDGDDKWLAGVCSGIASRLGVDPIVIRAVLVLLVVLGGVGITVYLIAWAFLPNNHEEIIAEKALRDGDVLGIILLVVVGLSLIGGTGLAGDSSGLGWIWWVVVPIGLVVWLVTRNRDGRKARTGQPAYGPPPASYGAQPAYGPPPASYGAQPGSAWPASSPSTPAWSTSAPAVATPPFAPGQTPEGAGTGTEGSAAQAPDPQNPVPETQEYSAVSTTYAPTTYAPAPGATPPGGVYAPPPAPVAPRPKPPKVPRRRSGGFVATLLVGGLALAAYGAALSIHDAANWAGSDQTVALAAALAVLGLGTLVLGLLGRRAGFTGFLAVVLALVTWTSSVVPDVTFGGGIGERTWRPSATDTAAKYRLGIGSAALDLADAPDNPGTARQIEARVGIGELRIYIPDNLTVEVHSSVGAGDISRMGAADLGPIADPGVNGDGGPVQLNGQDGRNISTVETFGTGAPDVVVDAHVGLGQILIGRE
jgi:phage shock protein PspC (stress-responsive transcriptional regulator)